VPGRNEPLYFFDLLYAIDAVKSARHHPEGVLWLRTGDHAVHAEPVSILDIAATIYDLMGVRSIVGHDVVRGVSLAPRFRSRREAERRYVA
jgi:predicted AlkP superfamily phosphohydrolase/phosphomutase